MSLFHPNRSHRFTQIKYLRSYASLSSKEVHTPKPIYPPIYDVSKKATQERNTLEMHAKIQALNTVEEKLLALLVPKYYGWETLMLDEKKVPYNFLPFVKSITQTRVHLREDLPVDISLGEEQLKEVVEILKKQLEKILVFHSKSQRHKYEIEGKTLPQEEIYRTVDHNIIQQINRVLVSNLSRQCPHLLQAQVDYEPRIEAFWNVGGFKLTEKEREKRKRKKVAEELQEEPMTRWIQYFGRPLVQLRSNLPLGPLNVNATEQSGTEEVNAFPYDPVTTYALEAKRFHGATIPGFWPNDEHTYGLLSFHSRSHHKARSEHYDAEDNEEAIHASAVLASYAWLLGQASYNGFTTFNELTYPLTTQTILSDGHVFSFYAYQMNTCVTFQDTRDSRKTNECFATGSMELYHAIEDDQIKGWNEKALLHLISMYMNSPQERKGVDMTPYLNKKESLVQHIELEKKRIWLHNKYRWFTSHRKRKYLDPEIYDWEYIYKIAFETRPFDARKRFFEKGEDPLEDRRMGDGEFRYIPKPLRPESESRKKYEDTFYPDV